MGNKHVRDRFPRIAAAITLAIAAYATFGTHQTFAIASTTTTNTINTLKISPVRTDVSIQPGQSKTISMKVTNLTKSPMVLQPIENDFIAGDEKGTPALILDANKYAPTHSLKRYMVPMQNITIPASATQETKLTITVPANAKPGGYYGAVRFAPVNKDGSASVNLSASAASIVLLTVPGDMVEQLSMTNFDIKQEDKIVNGFITTPDKLSLTVRFENKGSVQTAPFGQVYVKDGNKVIYSHDFNQAEPKDMILPDSARRWDVPLDKLGTFGKYTIGATFTYGTKNQSIEVNKTIWVIPMMYIIAGVVGGIVLILLIVGIWLFLRSYKRRILRGSGMGSGHRRR